MYETKPAIEIMRGLAQKLSKPLWEITKKHDEDIQEELKSTPEDEHVVRQYTAQFPCVFL